MQDCGQQKPEDDFKHRFWPASWTELLQKGAPSPNTQMARHHSHPNQIPNQSGNIINVYLCHHAEVLVACYLKGGLFSVCFNHLALSSPSQELCKRNTVPGSAAHNSSKAPAASYGPGAPERHGGRAQRWERSRRAARCPDPKAADKAARSTPRAGAGRCPSAPSPPPLGSAELRQLRLTQK